MPFILRKTVKLIKNRGKDYLIAVKKNQKTLYQQLQQQFEQSLPLDVSQDLEKTRDRVTQRTVSVLAAPDDLGATWAGIQRLVRVERVGRRGDKPYQQTVFYISSLTLDAEQFGARIRQHWHIENRLHWVKDVVMKEDETPVCDGHAHVNFGLIRTFALNLFRLNGYESITQGIRMLAHDIQTLFSFLQ